MYKRLVMPLLQAEKRIKEYRSAEQWKQVRDICLLCIAAFLVMSVLNLIQRSYVMLVSTLVSAAVLAYFLEWSWHSRNTTMLEWTLVAVLGVLCTYYVFRGGNEGFSILWLALVPFLFTLMIDALKGIVLSFYLLVLLFLTFYGPLGTLLQYDYSPTMRLRFPIFYAIDFALSFYCAIQLIRTRDGLILAQEQAREASFLDVATGLKNRTAFTHFTRTAREQGFLRLTVIYIDVNGLHELNNRLGHAAGDEMLRFIAKACVDQFPLADVFRLGGDEFLIACPVATESEIHARVDALVHTIESAGYTIAYGIAHRFHDFDLEAMVNEADSKMLKNKADFYRTHDRRQR